MLDHSGCSGARIPFDSQGRGKVAQVVAQPAQAEPHPPLDGAEGRAGPFGDLAVRQAGEEGELDRVAQLANQGLASRRASGLMPGWNLGRLRGDG